ncbi:hypothetical protein HPP92_012902 [Vanilla planifolia]|uniref:Uncharacterized protein n=1 Tax=Vanilla planifolia TaxID=51239 RepID=A0A835QUM8_VANPL|nr:hypothetical protein HPP92_012902 [Vanilla planifolia]
MEANLLYLLNTLEGSGKDILGLSNCTIIKELYLAGNKISEVEGLHRLLKLTVFDLSFNKITTTKALGQLVANYNSLLALNLVGNPLQNNLGDEQMRKAVLSLLPNIAYLNKLPIRQQRAREVMLSSLTKAALGDDGRSLRRRPTKRAVQSLGPSAKSKLGEGSSKNLRSKNRKHQHSSQRK